MGSPTFGQWAGAELSAENKLQIYIPPGFAHGFQATSEIVEVQYQAEPEVQPIGLREPSRGTIRSVGVAWPLDEPDPLRSGPAGQQLRGLRTTTSFSVPTMRVGFDARALVSPAAGVRRYARELFGAMAGLGGVDVVATGTAPGADLPAGISSAAAAREPPYQRRMDDHRAAAGGAIRATGRLPRACLHRSARRPSCRWSSRFTTSATSVTRSGIPIIGIRPAARSIGGAPARRTASSPTPSSRSRRSRPATVSIPTGSPWCRLPQERDLRRQRTSRR